MGGAATVVAVDFFSDIVCPWCLIGKRRLEQAVDLHGGVVLDIRWRCFLLNPNMPEGGMDRGDYLAAKFGDAAKSLHERIAAAGREAGIGFRFDAITRTPDSRPAHCLVLAAGDSAGAVADELFEAYFIKGLDIGDGAVLGDVAARHSIPYPAGAHAGRIEGDIDDASRLGIQGVPFFVFDGELAISGAHPPKTFLPILDAVVAGRRRPAAAPGRRSPSERDDLPE